MDKLVLSFVKTPNPTVIATPESESIFSGEIILNEREPGNLSNMDHPNLLNLCRKNRFQLLVRIAQDLGMMLPKPAQVTIKQLKRYVTMI